MRQMKTLTIVLFSATLFLTFNSNGYARPSMPSADELINSFVKKVDLTDVQISQIYSIIEELVAQKNTMMQEARSQGRSAMFSMKSKMQKINEETEDKLAEYLTYEQIVEWRKVLDEMRSKMKASGKSGGRFGRSGGHGGW